MKRRASAAVVLALMTIVVGCGNSEDDQTAGTTTADTTTAPPKDCPKGAGTNASYSSKFEGSVSMDQPKHVVSVTRDGRPVSGASVCIDTAMVGMKSMRYTARGRELAPGRYEVGVDFAMEGEYRGSVTATEDDEKISIPLTVKVGAKDKKAGDSMSDDKDGMSDDKDGMSDDKDGMSDDKEGMSDDKEGMQGTQTMQDGMQSDGK